MTHPIDPLSHRHDPAAEAGDTRWRSYLATLPDAAPSDALWQRLQQAQAARATPAVAMPRTARWPWLASAAALVVAVMATQLLPSTAVLPGAVQPDANSPPVAPPAAGYAAADAPSRASLLRLDAALERAYQDDAGDAELAALLQARDGVLDSLASAEPAQLLQL